MGLRQIYKYLVQLVQEHTLEILVPQHSGFTFLDRMTKASQFKSLRELENSFLFNSDRKVFENNTTHLSDLRKRCKKEALKELRAVKSMTFVERIRKEGPLKSLMHFFEVTEFSGYELQEIADRKFEEQRVIANVIGLGIMITVHFSKGNRKCDKIFVLLADRLQRVLRLSISIWTINVQKKGRRSQSSVGPRIRPTKKS